MAIKFKSSIRNTKRIGVSGKAGCGKSTAIARATKKPLVIDLERKWTRDLLPVQPIDIGEISFSSLKSTLLGLLKEPNLQPYDTLWIDSASEMFRVCERHAIETCYAGKKEKYSSFQNGPRTELPQFFSIILNLLSEIETKHKIDVGIVCHVGEGLKHNPMGEDYDKIVLDVHNNLVPMLLKWFDYLGCIYDEIDVSEDGLRKKVNKESKRVISFDNSCPLYDAKCASLASAKVYDFDINGNWYKELFNIKETK